MVSSKLWLGVGAFALMQTANVAVDGGTTRLSLAPPAAEAAQWGERGERGPYWNNRNRASQCAPGQRWVVRNGWGECASVQRGWNERGNPQWNERGQRGNPQWNERGERGQWNERGERGKDWR